MAAPMLHAASVLGLRFLACKHISKDRNVFQTVKHNSYLRDVFLEHHDVVDNERGKPPTVSIRCATALDPKEWFEIEGNMTVGTLIDNFGIKCVQFLCESEIQPPASAAEMLNKCAEEATHTAVNAFQLLMAGGRSFPPQKTRSPRVKTGLSNKDELYNHLILDMQTKCLDFPKTLEATQGAYFVQVLCNALWYITNHHGTINSAAARHRDVLSIPEAFDMYDNYNDLKRKKLKMDQLNAKDLESHAQALYSLLLKPVVNSSSQWQKCGKEIEHLADCLHAYVLHLERKNSEMQNNQSKTEPVRTIDKHASLGNARAAAFIKEKYRLINDAVIEKGENGYVVFDETLHLEQPFKSNDDKFKYFTNLRLTVPVDIVKFCPGGSLEASICIRQVKANRTEPQILTEGARFLQTVRPELNEIHTRTQRRLFKLKLNNITHISPAIADFIYTHFSIDKSAAESPVTQERLRLIFLGQTGLVKDLRELNPGRPNNKFDTFFGVLSGILEGVTAVDDRRHGEAHMSQFISLDEMISQVKDQCPEGTPIPSTSLVRLQFAPKNPYSRLSTSFTSRLNLQHKVQRRQLRVAHPDEHYCNAQFKYIKECAVEHKSQAKLIFCDDKAKVPFGTSENLVSTGVRGKKSIVPSTSTLCALDHDMQALGSLTPSVYLDCQIPESTGSSFVRGQVTTIVNDSVFMQSSPFRHSAALVKILSKDVQPLLFKFTDGGTDQRNNLESVKCASICLFKELNLDMLVLGRCAPGHSYINPAERVMSLLNLGLQNVALGRPPCEENAEKLISKSNSMQEIRNLAVKHPHIKQAWEDSVAEVSTTVSVRFSRLKLKDIPFSVMNPVSEEEIDILKRHLRELFPDLDLTKLVKSTTSKSAAYKKWMSEHSRSRQYTFQLRKCSDPTCCLPSVLPRDELLWIPDPVLDDTGDHYKSYHMMKGTETTDDLRPSLTLKQKNKKPVIRVEPASRDEPPTLEEPATAEEPTTIEEPTNTPVQNPTTTEVYSVDPVIPTPDAHLCTVQNARAFVNCTECLKPRLIYAKRKLSEGQKISLAVSLGEFVYSCGGPILHPSNPLYKTCLCRVPLSCSMPVETPYYGSMLGRIDICCYCCAEDCAVDSELKKNSTKLFFQSVASARAVENCLLL